MNLAVDVMIQARMGSKRLPGKVLLPLAGVPALGLMLERVKRATNIRRIFILTTELSEDDILESFASAFQVDLFRGSENDLLSRYVEAARKSGTDVVVRLTGDCPFIDPALIQRMVRLFLFNYPRIDFLTNCYTRTFARGFDVEILTFSLLEQLDKVCKMPHEREHVVPYVEENKDLFNFFEYPNDVDDSEFRMTLDTMADYETLSNVYSGIGKKDFSYCELISFLRENPSLIVNSHVQHKKYTE